MSRRRHLRHLGQQRLHDLRRQVVGADASTSEPLTARPIGLRAVATMTASGMTFHVSYRPVATPTRARRPGGPVRSRIQGLLVRSGRMDLPAVALDDIDLSDFEFWIADRAFREGAFKTLRDTPGLQFFTERVIEGFAVPAGPRLLRARPPRGRLGREPQRRSCSARARARTSATCPQEMNEFFGSMINMDDPKHFRLRSIVSKGFTPKEVARVEQYVYEKAERLVDRLLEQVPRRRVRLRRADRRATAARDHLRHDGHPRARTRRRSSAGRT